MNDLRAKALQRRRTLSESERTNASALICKRVVESRVFRSAKNIACYLPMRDEVDTRVIIERAWRANKRVFLPVIAQRGEMSFQQIRPDTPLRRNRLSIWEPESGDFISPRLLQLVVTPTVAFDAKRHRIGMGGGYYDRCFSFLRHRKLWLQPRLIGVAFRCQEVEEFTPNTWDIPLYQTVTDHV